MIKLENSPLRYSLQIVDKDTPELGFDGQSQLLTRKSCQNFWLKATFLSQIYTYVHIDVLLLMSKYVLDEGFQGHLYFRDKAAMPTPANKLNVNLYVSGSKRCDIFGVAV